MVQKLYAFHYADVHLVYLYIIICMRICNFFFLRCTMNYCCYYHYSIVTEMCLELMDVPLVGKAKHTGRSGTGDHMASKKGQASESRCSSSFAH